MIVLLPLPFGPTMAISSAPSARRFEVERDLVETQAVADAAEAFEGESEWLHGMPRS